MKVLERTERTTVVALEDSCLREGLAGLRWHLPELLADGAPTLVVDLADVRRLSSATVAALLWAKRQCRARGGRVVLRHPSPRSLDQLVRTGLSPLFEITETPPVPASRPGARVPARTSPSPLHLRQEMP